MPKIVSMPCCVCGKPIIQELPEESGFVKVKCRKCVEKETEARARKSRMGVLKALLKMKRSDWTEEGLYRRVESSEKFREILVDFKDTHSEFYLEQWLHGLSTLREGTLKALIKKEGKIHV